MIPNEIINKLNMFSIPEGGMASEILRSADFVETQRGVRHRWTSIYYLLCAGERSCFHRLQSDEIWAHHAGGAFTIYMIEDGKLFQRKLDSEIKKDGQLQVLIPAGTIFAACVESAWGLCGCVTVPGFHTEDIELLSKNDIGNIQGDSGLIDFLCCHG